MTSPNQIATLPEVQPQRAADILTREIAYPEATDFVGGCAVFAETIAKEHPDIIFFPQRGAGPIEWTTEVLIENAGNRMPAFVDLPIGTHTTINADRPELSGISGSQKRALIEQTIDSLIEDGRYVPGKSRLMLIDEVQKGGTISQAAQAIRDAMTKHGDEGVLSVIAAQDSRHKLIGDDRTEAFKKLAGNERKGFKTTTVPTAMFMVDRPQFLDEIWKTNDAKAGSLDDFVINNNDAARRIFRTLAMVYLDPGKALDELEELHRHITAEDLGSTVLQAEVLEAMTDPVPVKGNKHATEKHLFNWWNNFARSLQNKRAGSARPMRPFEPVQ